LDSDEAAELLRIHPKTLQRMARNRQIHGIQVGKLWRFRASDLEIWLRTKKAGYAGHLPKIFTIAPPLQLR